jgi:hypothetical protein
MKHNLFCLALAVAFGIVPAGAQNHHVYFDENLVENDCPFAITLLGAQRITFQPAEQKVLTAHVTTLLHQGFYLPQSSAVYKPGNSC